MKKDISRRNFLKLLGGGAITTAAVLTGCKSKTDTKAVSEYTKQVEPPVGKMTYRTNPKTNEKVSILGYGMMRLPSKTENKDDYDQEMINKQIDYALEHGVNYFDTSPVYCQGKSEACTGIALSRHKRSEYFIATKLSNFHPDSQTREGSIGMYQKSLKDLQVDYIDYYLLHAIGGGMDEFNKRYVDNGMMDFLMKEREAGRIRNLGFSFHGYKAVFDEVLAMHDKYHWDFVQIELNYLDWNYADEINDRNVDASYLYAELQKYHIPAVIMEPLLGGRLANLPQYLVNELKQHAPDRSVASWAFRYAGTPKGVLTVLSGMTYMEHLKDNLLSYCPLKPLTKKEQESRRYVYDKFTESCDKREINVQPGLEYISNENSGKTLHIEIIGIKLTPGMDYSQFYKDGYISSIVERYLDGHGEFENTNYIYDENGYYPVDEEGNTIQKKWSYRYDMYAYFYKVI